MDKDKRRSLTIRLQPRDGRPLAEVVDWLNQMTKAEKNEQAAMLLMALLPYARATAGETPQEIERCYWESHHRLDQYLHLMRQELKIAVPHREASVLVEEEPLMSLKEMAADQSAQSAISPFTKGEREPVTARDIDSMFGRSTTFTSKTVHPHCSQELTKTSQKNTMAYSLLVRYR